MPKQALFSVLRNGYEWLVSLVGTLTFVFICLITTWLRIFPGLFLSPSQNHWLGRRAIHYVTRFFFAVLELSGLVHTDFKDLDRLYHQRGIIITANHPCLMDALFVMSRLPNVVCVMKASVVGNPFFAGAASMAGFIRSDSAKQFIRQCQQSLDQGAQLLLFPEGTRTVQKPINPFQSGFSLIAKKSQAPVQTVFIQANTHFLGKHWPALKKPEFPLKYSATLGECFQFDQNQDHKAFTARLASYFKNNL